MNESVKRFLCIGIICLFINFVFMNTVFVHAHSLGDGSIITHSHPMLPTSAHTHTSEALSLIAQCNLVAGSMEGTPQVSVECAGSDWEQPHIESGASAVDAYVAVAKLRGPPGRG